MMAEEVEITLYQDCVPDFIESSLENLYENIFSSLVFLKAFNKNPVPISTYILEKNQVPNVVLLFRIEKNYVRVLNESMTVSAKEIERFSSYIFARYAEVNMISFNAIRTDLGPISYPFQRFTCLEDIVVMLPQTQQEYMASLSKAMRKNIKRYLNKTRAGLPSLQHRILVGDEIEEWHVHGIIELNKSRMQRKHKVSTYDASDTKHIIQLAKSCGFIRIMELDGVIVAGEICSRVGTHYFSHIGAHDPAYDEYRLGTLNCYLTICECISRGGKQFHFLWGQYDYKYSLLGVQQDLNHVALYRSHTHLWLNGAKAFKLECEALLRAMKNLMHSQAKKENASGGLVKKLTGVIRSLKGLFSFKASEHAYEEKPAVSQAARKSMYQNPVLIKQEAGRAKAGSVKAAGKTLLAEKACID